ncbi:helix-turn-helix domain-containing protein [Candidatus Bathyarchaeota archaeon]|nr:helix-turn-helix domain-containing protein [Candidatus Bathyarchaeota archaeon]
MESNSISELDSILAVLENPVRRRIIDRLSQEPTYPLQMSKELGISQQLVTKHLEMMSDAGVVASSRRDSPVGPRRREYLLNKSISITIDFAPHLFNARILTFGTRPHQTLIKSEVTSLMDRIEKVSGYPEEKRRIAPLATIVEEIDGRLKRLEDERSVLLYVRNLAMREAGEAIFKTEENTDAKRVIHYVLDEHNRNVQEISKSLNMRETEVREILSELKRIL